MTRPQNLLFIPATHPKALSALGLPGVQPAWS